ncbi:MAG: lipopolysaccharide biosynthesis protein, partial [Muribaculaceae bacterium]|nr:lipopolysaccharide biosynthesis protein [Muribaculaceae bacterium]
MMAVSLFTFRELLKELGVEDYGTYNVVGGLVIMFSFLSSAMTTSNQRFLSYHIGRRDSELLKQTFCMIINI